MTALFSLFSFRNSSNVALRFANRPQGFDALRLLLAACIVAFHSVTISHGSAAVIPRPVMVGLQLVLPAFFALSGFLVASSLARSRSVWEFLAHRFLRLWPGLAGVVLASMFLLGPALTTLDIKSYFSSPTLFGYLSNLVGMPAYALPGVFEQNPRPGVANGSLWTLPLEALFYLLLVASSIAGLFRSPRLLAFLVSVVAAASVFGTFLPGWSGLALAFSGGVLVFLFAAKLPLHGGAAALSFLLAYALTYLPQWQVLAGLPLAYACIWAGCRQLPRLPGDYSYGLYLMAYPLQQTFIEFFPASAWWSTLAVALTGGTLLAALSWHLLEQPILVRGRLAASRTDKAASRGHNCTTACPVRNAAE